MRLFSLHVLAAGILGCFIAVPVVVAGVTVTVALWVAEPVLPVQLSV